MHISSIELKNIRCFEHIKVDLGSDGTPVPWAVVLGDNGAGKSTLLRCIALGLAPTSLAASMLVEAGGEWVRQGATSGEIRITLETGEQRALSIKRDSDGEVILRTPIPHTLGDGIFVCGYGAARRSYGARSFQSYSVRDAVSTLFNYDAELQNPELILRRIGDEQGTIVEILRRIDNVLMLPDGSTRLGVSGLEVRGPWGDFTPVGSLGDGYRATLAWVLDFLGWVMFWDIKMLQTGITGIVLVDEIEQHLHPQWQRRILSQLGQQFPKVQFIVTTHSSLCVIGTTDFADDAVSLIHLRQYETSVEALSGLKPPRGLRADQVLTSYLFGLETTGDDQTKFEIERLSKLLSEQQRTSDEEAEVLRLRDALGQKLGSEETELERRVSHAARQVVASELERRLDTGQQSASAALATEKPVELEVKRQFQELIAKL